MIELKNLTTGYGEHIVARSINSIIPEGNLISLLGPNGVGKSTLLRTLCAFQPAISGDIIINGTSLQELTQAQLSRIISVVLTERLDVRAMTVHNLVSLGRSPYTGFWGRLDEEDERQVRQAIDQVGISELYEREIGTLSDGELQKAMIAKALAQQTPIILLDEPTAFLDFPSKVEMMRMLHRLAHEMNKTIFLSTHDVEMALQLSDQLWLMTAEGVHSGTPDELTADGSLADFIHIEGIHFDSERKLFIIEH
ncbi:MAG: ABC transporter ATP-binding protein [Bacteroidaceae bacterium]|jgi:iron complex transport system ATP-binding protein|nr:ABC transporter ATP-binding protein [Bacteroidaceae bacterium]MBQ6085797.1 ABC transporter ATP-binding protein [Bacteroidaceae bacterium]MBR3546728.1 ABC transporter ATP-binding protein [Bacteroidaceae bacterium]MBR4527582.1 ABC transporter ATP-binding protein [Bacteroidaceae bacterium]